MGGLGCGYSCNLHIGRRRLGGKRDLGRALHQKKIELSPERNVPRSFLSEKNYKWIFLSNDGQTSLNYDPDMGAQFFEIMCHV